MLDRAHLAMNGVQLTTLVMIGTDCRGSCKSNYHTMTTAMVPVVVTYIVYLYIYMIYIYFEKIDIHLLVISADCLISFPNITLKV